jgi:23S rRNA (adenine2503-C2)-methyltransferase
MDYSYKPMKNDSISLCDLTFDELQALGAEFGAPAFRARQIWRWLYVANASDWHAMTDLPSALRRSLAARYPLDAARLAQTAGGGTATGKFLIELADGERIEAALIPAAERLTLCVSSQVGCRYHCAFCASGQNGWRRHLSTGEIVSQFRLAWRAAARKPTHVVFMGVGEPLDNYDAVRGAVLRLNDAAGLAVAARRITLSTCGLAPAIERLAGETPHIELSVSLHAPDDELRSRLMPINRQYGLATLLRACRRYAERTGRIVTFEYTLIRNVNDATAQARALARLLRTLPCRVNLIPLSPVPEYPERPAAAGTAALFIEILRQSGINATLRRSRGSDIDAACGQLRAAAAGSRPALKQSE